MSTTHVVQGFRGRLLLNELMRNHTSLKIGGPVDLYAIPEDIEDLLVFERYLRAQHIPWMVIGGGYNLLVRDGGIRGAVISLELFNRIEKLTDDSIRAEAGSDNLSIVRFGQQLKLGGIGFISGIPGSIGGAVRMNAGAYGNGLLDHAVSLSVLRQGTVLELQRSQISYGYRRLDLEAEDIILAATLQLVATTPSDTEEEIRKDLELRRTKHNVGFPSAGSYFKNPPDHSAWKLINAAGMRGASVGGAQMSELHSNFLINRGGATAADCLELAGRVKGAVLHNSGIMLDEEVRVVGEEP